MLQIREQFALREYNTLGVVSKAEHFCVLATEQDVIDAQEWGQAQGQKLQILGGGSNLILGASVPGLVGHMNIRGRKALTRGDSIYLYVGAGENWHELVEYSVAQGWWGLETLALIPGLVGAAPIQNIGAYGSELTSVVESVRVWDAFQGRIRMIAQNECEFGYRDSLFKQTPPGRYVVLGLNLQLGRRRMPRDMYPDVRDRLAETGISPDAASVRQIMNAVVQVRQRKLPDPQLQGNVGSVFKNPVVTLAEADRLVKKVEHLQRYPHSHTHVKLSAAQLIDQAGCKGMEADGFGLWPTQPLVVVNQNGTEGAAFIRFAEAIAARVDQQFRVRLQLEPQRMGLS